jgi:hypothetical protein
MKNVLFVLFFAAASTTVAAQNSGTTANAANRLADSIGTTAYGLPVHKSYVPADAAERAKKKYGRALYSIEKSSANDCQESYLVGLIRNGRLTMEWMCDDPKMVWHRQPANLRYLLAAK